MDHDGHNIVNCELQGTCKDEAPGACLPRPRRAMSKLCVVNGELWMAKYRKSCNDGAPWGIPMTVSTMGHEEIVNGEWRIVNCELPHYHYR